MEGSRRWRRSRPFDPLARAGLLSCTLLGVVAVAWVAGWAWLAALAAFALVGVAAVAVGVDSRLPGDWRRARQP